MGRSISRRTFFFGSAMAVSAASFARPRRVSAADKLNVAAIGAGGKGRSDINGCKDENVIALCDVDWNSAAETFSVDFPEAKKYKDFRVMLDELKEIDAVTVSTADHCHGIAAVTAMQLGKHVYVQKPLTHNIYEARKLRDVAREMGVATQMGNQGHANEGVRQVCEMVWSGAIGEVHEAHCWTNRPIWPQAIEPPTTSDPVPEYLDWDLWLGPAAERPFVDKHPVTGERCYCPFVWRGWWDFGTGALGDMACHICDPANWALHLGAPTTIELVNVTQWHEHSGPTASVIKYEFPERQNPEGKTLAPVTLYWHDGMSEQPKIEGVPEGAELGEGSNGSVFIGSEGMLTCGTYGDHPRLVPEELMNDYQKPDPTIARTDGTYADWLKACRGEGPSCANFDYSAPFTEWVLLGVVAQRAGGKIEWDAENMLVKNDSAAQAFIKRDYRPGWEM